MTKAKTTEDQKPEDHAAEIERLKTEIGKANGALRQANQALLEAGKRLDHANMANDGYRAQLAQLQTQLQQVVAENAALKAAKSE